MIYVILFNLLRMSAIHWFRSFRAIFLITGSPIYSPDIIRMAWHIDIVCTAVVCGVFPLSKACSGWVAWLGNLCPKPQQSALIFTPSSTAGKALSSHLKYFFTHELLDLFVPKT